MALPAPGLLVIVLCCASALQLDGNGYTGVLFAINPSLPEDQALLHSIQDMVKEASLVLYGATGGRFYFKEVTILVPVDWTNGNYSEAKTQTYQKANVIIDEPNKSYGDEPYTLQYGQCGQPGQYIHLTPNFLLDDKFIKVYGQKSKVFVHEWGHLRWGLYDEYSEEQPFYHSLDGMGTVEATRCSKGIQGRYCVIMENTCYPCSFNQTTGLPTGGCVFLPSQDTSIKQSIMAFQSLDHVTEFCSDETHNPEAPNQQNKMCDNRAALDVILNSSVDNGTQPLSTPISKHNTTINIVQRKGRVVCLTLDVSGSMRGANLDLLRQAATLFLRTIIEDKALVGIVQFESSPSVLKNLTEIDGEQSREDLVQGLPTGAGGFTYICAAIDEAFQVLRGDDGSTVGDELILLTDGMATDSLSDCEAAVNSSGAIVHTIALGQGADRRLNKFAQYTDGIYHQVNNRIDSNELIDAFTSFTTTDGNMTEHTTQLESSGKRTTDWFNGTFSVDRTVGKDTVVTVVYEASAPSVHIRNPNGKSFNQSDFHHYTQTKTLSLKLQGIAEIGTWQYSLLNEGSGAQSLAITVTSRAASADVPPITVKAHMDQKSSDGSKAMVVYAAVTQKGLPVTNVTNVMATLESDIGHKVELPLLDNGAGADAFKHDGIYSRYFINMTSGRYSLKVRVKNQNATLSAHKHSGVLYIPGYVENGKVELNPPKPPVNHDPVEVGSFTRTATGESFVVTLPMGSKGPPAFPPSKITDLRAELQEDNVTLTWTAPGASYDQGKALLYHIGWSEDLALMRNNYSDTQYVNTSVLSPQQAGSVETFSFLPYNSTMGNGTSLFIAIVTKNNESLTSEMSNIARVVKVILPVPSTSTRPPPTQTSTVILPVPSTSTRPPPTQTCTVILPVPSTSRPPPTQTSTTITTPAAPTPTSSFAAPHQSPKAVAIAVGLAIGLMFSQACLFC